MTINPDLFVDREDEKKLFRKMLSGESAIRVLIFAVDSGKGKSSLMKRLGRICERTDPPVRSALVHLKKPEATSEVKTELDLATAIVEAFARSDADSANFCEFTRLQTALAGRDRETFGFLESRVTHTYVKVDASGVTDSNITGANIYMDGFDEKQRKIAETQCVAAFRRDLAKLLSTAPAFILIDGWDGCPVDLRWWFEQQVVKPHIAQVQGGPSGSILRLVVAGLPHEGNCGSGISEKEFGSFFDEAAFARYVHRRTSLSRIEESTEDVVAFMNLHGGHYIPRDKLEAYSIAIAAAMATNLVNASQLVRHIGNMYVGGGLSA